MIENGKSAEPDRSVELLSGLLRLELKRTCRDDAAVGGFSRLARATVETLAATSALGPGVAAELRSLFSDYEFADHDERERRCRAALLLLRGTASQRSHSSQATLSSPRQISSDTKTDGMAALLGTLGQSISYIWGIGPRMQEILGRLGISRIADLLQHAPRSYLDLRHPVPVDRESLGKMILVRARLLAVTEVHRKVLLIKATAKDTGGRTLRLIWFNNRFVRGRLAAGRDYDFYGRLDNSFDGPQLVQPIFEESGTPAAQLHMNRIVPLYHLTAGVTQKTIRTQLWRALGMIPSGPAEYLPSDISTRFGLPDLISSYRSLHFPADETAAEHARSRFAFDSLYLFELKVLMRQTANQAARGVPFKLPEETVEEYVSALPYEPTHSQTDAMRDIERDVRGRGCMHRLLHGDVGSGKTAVAGYAVFAAKSAGYQSAVLSPTEILADQTGHVLSSILAPLGVRVATLTGGTPKARRKEILTALATGELDCLIGTHAILEEGVAFACLGLSVVDEQHRFGVVQRTALTGKGAQPHSLVMSATPIPRTLALTIYGDLDISELQEKPRGRLPIETRAVKNSEREEAYALVRHQVSEGRQAFVVVPAIDSSDEEEGPASVQETLHRLTETSLQGLHVGSLHGRMKSKDKEAIMDEFRSGNLDVLIATSVVEVGVDVPNATVMVVENAERFGLATLHQLRGRVGRSGARSYCVLIDGSDNAGAGDRLKVLVESDDGFAIAEEDLRLRGPGDILGTVQHGYDVPLFGSTSVLTYRDLAMLPDIRASASRLLEEDPDLTKPSHQALAAMLALRYPSPSVSGGN